MRNILLHYDFDMILGDFNINYYNEDEMKPLQRLMTSFNYDQIVQSPTFISFGSLLDHVYVKTNNCNIIKCSVLPVYYSDHKAIEISLNT